MQPATEQVAQMMAGAEPVDFEIIGGEEPVVRVKLSDKGKEAILRLKVVVGTISRIGTTVTPACRSTRSTRRRSSGS